MNPEYRPQNLHDALVRLAEECAEVAKECCKGLRFGVHDCDPNKDDGKKTNIQRIKEEFDDLALAYADMIKFYKLEHPNPPCRHDSIQGEAWGTRCLDCGKFWNS